MPLLASKGIRGVCHIDFPASGPMVRSSYHADVQAHDVI